MKVIEYQAAIESLKGLLEQYNRRAQGEAQYLLTLRFTDVPAESALSKQHASLYKGYTGRCIALRNALARLSKLAWELDEEVDETYASQK